MVAERLVVGEPEHLVDDPVVRHAQAEGQATVGDGLDRQGLLGQGDGVAWLTGTTAVPISMREVAAATTAAAVSASNSSGDLGDPDRGESRLLGPLGVRLQAGHLGRVPSACGSNHQSDAHPGLLPTWCGRDENGFLLRRKARLPYHLGEFRGAI